jgi:hypothetical protein
MVREHLLVILSNKWNELFKPNKLELVYNSNTNLKKFLIKGQQSSTS